MNTDIHSALLLLRELIDPFMPLLAFISCLCVCLFLIKKFSERDSEIEQRKYQQIILQEEIEKERRISESQKVPRWYYRWMGIRGRLVAKQSIEELYRKAGKSHQRGRLSQEEIDLLTKLGARQ